MPATLENIGQLERRLNITLPAVEIDDEVQSRLKRLARSVKMHGFRPGKVPLKVVAQQYENQVRREVLGDALQKSFGDAIREQNLKVAGYPRFEPRSEAESAPEFEFSATFDVNLKQIAEPRLAPVDAEFAKSLGVADGNLDTMRAQIRENLGRETRRRISARVKDQIMQALLDATRIEVPKSLVELEIERMTAAARQDLEARGVKPAAMPPIPREAFEQQAQRRVALGLILGEVVKTHGLQAKPEQVRAMVEEQAQTYENPEQWVKWFYQAPERLREVESLVLEDNVVAWALATAKVEDKPIVFDDLMGNA